MTNEEAYNRIKQAIDAYFEFVSLVKRMREAQEALEKALRIEDIEEINICDIRVLELESEVDEYLKQMGL